MKNDKRTEAGSSARIPPYWTSSVDSRGERKMTYAVRGGKAQVMLAILGAITLSCGTGFILWLIRGGGSLSAG